MLNLYRNTAMQKDISQLVDSAFAAKVALQAARDEEADVAQLLFDGHLSVAAAKLQKMRGISHVIEISFSFNERSRIQITRDDVCRPF